MYVNVKSGTYHVGNRLFHPGSTECDDKEILDSVEADSLVWVDVSAKARYSDVSPPKAGAVFTTGDLQHKPALPVAAEESIAKTTEDVRSPAASLIDRLEEHSAPKAEPTSDGFSCDECDKEFKAAAGLASHKRIKHA